MARPFLAGFYFGLLMGLGCGAAVALIGSIVLGVLIGVGVWATGWPMFGLAIKHRWGLRADFEPPSKFALHQLLDGVSDRWLTFLMWFFGLSFVGVLLDLVTGLEKVTGFGGFFGGFLPLGLDILIVWALWSERRRRSKR